MASLAPREQQHQQAGLARQRSPANGAVAGAPGSPAYRGAPPPLWDQAMELEKRLRNELRKHSFWDPEVRRLRGALQTSYEALLFAHYDFAAASEVEANLWKAVFYRPIEEFRSRTKALEALVKAAAPDGVGKGPSRAPAPAGAALASPDEARAQLARTTSAYLKFLDEALAFYRKTTWKLQWACGSVGAQVDLDAALQNEIQETVPRASGPYVPDVRPSVHRCLIYLGDLCRYQSMALKERPSSARPLWERARGYYKQASAVLPSSGNPYNQLAVMAYYAGEELRAVYCYCRSLAVAQPFVTARENLLLLFEKNRAKYSAIASAHAALALAPGAGAAAGAGSSGAAADAAAARLAAAHLSDVSTRFVRLHGLLFDRINLDAFPEVLEAAMRDLCAMLGQMACRLSLQKGPEGDNVLLQLAALATYAVHAVAPPPPDGVAAAPGAGAAAAAHMTGGAAGGYAAAAQRPLIRSYALCGALRLAAVLCGACHTAPPQELAPEPIDLHSQPQGFGAVCAACHVLLAWLVSSPHLLQVTPPTPGGPLPELWEEELACRAACWSAAARLAAWLAELARRAKLLPQGWWTASAATAFDPNSPFAGGPHAPYNGAGAGAHGGGQPRSPSAGSPMAAVAPSRLALPEELELVGYAPLERAETWEAAAALAAAGRSATAAAATEGSAGEAWGVRTVRMLRVLRYLSESLSAATLGQQYGALVGTAAGAVRQHQKAVRELAQAMELAGLAAESGVPPPGLLQPFDVYSGYGRAAGDGAAAARAFAPPSVLRLPADPVAAPPSNGSVRTSSEWGRTPLTNGTVDEADPRRTAAPASIAGTSTAGGSRKGDDDNDEPEEEIVYQPPKPGSISGMARPMSINTLYRSNSGGSLAAATAQHMSQDPKGMLSKQPSGSGYQLSREVSRDGSSSALLRSPSALSAGGGGMAGGAAAADAAVGLLASLPTSGLPSPNARDSPAHTMDGLLRPPSPAASELPQAGTIGLLQSLLHGSVGGGQGLFGGAAAGPPGGRPPPAPSGPGSARSRPPSAGNVPSSSSSAAAAMANSLGAPAVAAAAAGAAAPSGPVPPPPAQLPMPTLAGLPASLSVHHAHGQQRSSGSAGLYGGGASAPGAPPGSGGGVLAMPVPRSTSAAPLAGNNFHLPPQPQAHLFALAGVASAPGGRSSGLAAAPPPGPGPGNPFSGLGLPLLQQQHHAHHHQHTPHLQFAEMPPGGALPWPTGIGGGAGVGLHTVGAGDGFGAAAASYRAEAIASETLEATAVAMADNVLGALEDDMDVSEPPEGGAGRAPPAPPPAAQPTGGAGQAAAADMPNVATVRAPHPGAGQGQGGPSPRGDAHMAGGINSPMHDDAQAPAAGGDGEDMMMQGLEGGSQHSGTAVGSVTASQGRARGGGGGPPLLPSPAQPFYSRGGGSSGSGGIMDGGFGSWGVVELPGHMHRLHQQLQQAQAAQHQQLQQAQAAQQQQLQQAQAAQHHQLHQAQAAQQLQQPYPQLPHQDQLQQPHEPYRYGGGAAAAASGLPVSHGPMGHHQALPQQLQSGGAPPSSGAAAADLSFLSFLAAGGAAVGSYAGGQQQHQQQPQG